MMSLSRKYSMGSEACVAVGGVEDDDAGVRRRLRLVDQVLHAHALPQYVHAPAFDAVQPHDLLVVLVTVHNLVVRVAARVSDESADLQPVRVLVHVLRAVDRVLLEVVYRRQLLALVLAHLGGCQHDRAILVPRDYRGRGD